MESNTEANAVQIEEVAVAAETERLLKVAAERNGIPVDDLRAQYNQAAREQAVKNLEEESKRGTSYKALYEQERSKREAAESIVVSIRSQATKQNDPGPKAEVVFAQAAARHGDLEWNHKLSMSQKFASCGIDAASAPALSKEAGKIFGSDSDPRMASDLHKADPRHYRQLKLVAILTDLIGPSSGSRY